MNNVIIFFNQRKVPVRLIGTDRKLLPRLIKALGYNKITIGRIRESLVKIDLLGTEAIVYSSQGDKFRIPIF